MIKISDSLSQIAFQPLLPLSNNDPSVMSENSLEQQKVSEFPSTNSSTNLKEKKDYELSMGEKAVIQAIEKANKVLEGVHTNLKFSIHKETKEIMVKVINSETNEVIREIPPEKVLNMVAKMMKMTGLLVDEHR